MNLFNRKPLLPSTAIPVLVFSLLACTVTAQVNPSVTHLITQLQNNGYAFVSDPSTGDVAVPNQFVLQFRDGTTQQWKDELQRALEGSITGGVPIRIIKKCNCETIESWEIISSSGVLSGGVVTTSKETASGMMSGDGELVEISPNYYQSISDAPSREDRRSNISLDAMIKGISPNKPQHKKIQLIDTGVDPIHPDQGFRNAIWNDPKESTSMAHDKNLNCAYGDKIGYNFVDDNNLPLDYHSHGTHVAGIVYQNSRCVPVKMLIAKAFDNKGIGQDMDITCAIYYGVKQKVDGINISGGRTGTESLIVRNAVETAIKNDIVVVAAAGNFKSDNDQIAVWPANFPDVLSVNAHKQANFTLWNWNVPMDRNANIGSNYGNNTVHLSALGENVKSMVPGGYALKSGTSMAAPVVAAAVAVVKKRNPTWTGQMIRDQLTGSAQSPNLQDYNQFGVLNKTNYCTIQKLEKIASSEATPTELNIAPNPATDRAQIEIPHSEQATFAQLLLTDMTGKVLLQKEIELATGNNVTYYSLDINELSKGMYVIKIQIGATFLHKKMMKL